MSNEATVTVTVTGVNDALVATNESAAAFEDGTPFLINTRTDDVDSDDSPATLSYDITSFPTEGTVSSNGDGRFIFFPGNDFQDLAEGETREVTFTYTATDVHDAVSNEATVTVTGVNDAPLTTNASATARENGPPVTISTSNQDVDSDDNPATLTYTIASFPTEGIVTSNGGGSFTFDPGNDFQDLVAGQTRQVTFAYTATDSHDAVSIVAAVTVTVTGAPETIVAGADAGGGPNVRTFEASTGEAKLDIMAYSASFTGGVRVATGDVNFDGIPDIITGTGPGGGPHVKVFDGQSGGVLRSFLAYPLSFSGGVYVASGDVDGDDFDDVLVSAQAGVPVSVFDGETTALLASFVPYLGAPQISDRVGRSGSTNPTVRVAAVDANGDGLADILTSTGAGLPPEVHVFEAVSLQELDQFFAFDPGFFGGVLVG